MIYSGALSARRGADDGICGLLLKLDLNDDKNENEYAYDEASRYEAVYDDEKLVRSR